MTIKIQDMFQLFHINSIFTLKITYEKNFTEILNMVGLFLEPKHIYLWNRKLIWIVYTNHPGKHWCSTAQ